MNPRSQSTLRTFASELPRPDNPYDDSADPIDFAKSMVEHNNEHNGAALDFWSAIHQAPDHTWWQLAWVYATGSAPRPCRHCSDQLDGSDPTISTATGEAFCGANPSGDRHEPEWGGDVVMCWWQQTSCPSCEGTGWIELYHPSTDAVTGARKCPETHPAPPPPKVSLVKPHLCDDSLCCPPF